MKDDHLFFEEHEHGKNRKASRQERKRLSDKDRSKYKKTDVDKIRPVDIKEGLKARVLLISPEGILCDSHHETFLCSLKGSLKKEKRLSKNLIAVGDEVILQQEDKHHVILQILPRKTVLSRADNLSRKKEQVIAANVDQVFITASILDPIFKPFLIDRYLIAAYRGDLVPIIIVTKVDLIATADELTQARCLDYLTHLDSMAKSLNITIIHFSAKTLDGLDEIKQLAKDKTSVFSGQSGVGKSTLINLITHATQSTAPIVSRTAKGSHTTTQAVMLPLKDEEGFVIDTPGIRSFGLWEIDVLDVRKYFKEIDEAGKLCKYPDCHHVNEPDCNVKILLDEGLINPLRFESYVNLLDQVKMEHIKR